MALGDLEKHSFLREWIALFKSGHAWSLKKACIRSWKSTRELLGLILHRSAPAMKPPKRNLRLFFRSLSIQLTPSRFVESTATTFKRFISFLQLVLQPKFISIKYLLIILVGIGVTIGVYYHKRTAVRKTRFAKPFNRTIFYRTPFYFPFEKPSPGLIGALPFTEVPNQNAKHNSHGFRSPEYTIAHPPNMYRIVILGNGITWGAGVTLEETFPYKLENLLNRRCEKDCFEVISLGMPRHTVEDMFINLLVHAQSLKPDVVLVQLPFHPIVKTAKTGYRQEENIDEALIQIHKWSDERQTPVAILHNDISTPGLNKLELPLLDLTATLIKAGPVQPAMKAGFGPAAHSALSVTTADFLFKSNLARCTPPQSERNDPIWQEENKIRKNANEQWNRYSVNRDEQLMLFEKLHRMFPADLWITNQLANLELTLKQNEKALATFSSLATTAPEITAPWFQMSLCVPEKNQQKLLLERALQVLPNHPLATTRLAGLYFEEKRTEEGCRLLRRFTEGTEIQAPARVAKAMMAKNHCTSTN